MIGILYRKSVINPKQAANIVHEALKEIDINSIMKADLSPDLVEFNFAYVRYEIADGVLKWFRVFAEMPGGTEDIFINIVPVRDEEVTGIERSVSKMQNPGSRLSL